MPPPPPTLGTVCIVTPGPCGVYMPALPSMLDYHVYTGYTCAAAQVHSSWLQGLSAERGPFQPGDAGVVQVGTQTLRTPLSCQRHIGR